MNIHIFPVFKSMNNINYLITYDTVLLECFSQKSNNENKTLSYEFIELFVIRLDIIINKLNTIVIKLGTIIGKLNAVAK